MSTDVKQQVMHEIKASPMFSIQLDESVSTVDVASCSQVLIFVRYVHMEDVKGKFLYCNVLKTTATAQDVSQNIFETDKACSGKSYIAFVRMEHRRYLEANLVSILKSKKNLLKSKEHIA